MEMFHPSDHRPLNLRIKLCLLIILPNLISGGLITSKFSPFNFSSLKSRFDLSSSSSSKSNIVNNYGNDEASGLNDLNQPSESTRISSSVSSALSSSSPSFPSSSFSTNSVTYGLPNLKDYTTSSTSLDVLPGGSMVQSPPVSVYPNNNFASMGQQASFSPSASFGSRFNYPGQLSRRSFNYPFSTPYGGGGGGGGGYPPAPWSMRPHPSQFSSRFRGYYPYHRNGLRRNSYKSRYGKSRKRYRKPYHYESRNYRSWYPRYRSSNKYHSDYDNYNDNYDSSIMGSESSPSETFYSLTSNNNSGSKDYLKIGGIGNNIISYLANSLLKAPGGGEQSKTINSTINSNSSSDTSKDSYDGPFIQFGETKISLKSNDKGGITVTVGRTKM